MGKVFLFEDLNSRVGRKHDFIDNDKIIGNDDIFPVDSLLPRASCDVTSNRFGELVALF